MLERWGGINQFSFAFGPTLLGQLQQVEGNYAAALLVCLAMQALAVIVVSLALPAIKLRRAERPDLFLRKHAGYVIRAGMTRLDGQEKGHVQTSGEGVKAAFAVFRRA